MRKVSILPNLMNRNVQDRNIKNMELKASF
nr:MAG TPA: hypothetical protein [Caudoviricetes sp.]